MASIEAIHFVAGLGSAESKDFTSTDLLAMRLASAMHPKAEVFVHTSNAIGTGDNYKLVPRLRRVTYDSSLYDSWPNWRIKGGAYMADKLRLYVLLTSQTANSLYLDTDAFMLKNLDHLAEIEGCAMARLGPNMIANGLIYAGRDKKFLAEWWRKLEATKAPPKSAVDYSCRMPHELAIAQPGLTVLDCAKYHGFTGDEAMQGAWCKPANSLDLTRLIADSCVIHTMSPRPELSYNSNYRKLIEILEALHNG
jgi:hypothetical protein